MNLIKSILGNIELTGETGSWQISASSETPEKGLELIHLDLSAPEAAVPPHIVLQFSTPQLDMFTRWYPMGHFNRNIPPYFANHVWSNLASSLPVMQTIDLEGENRVLLAVSDAMRQVGIRCGVNEKTNEVEFKIDLFSVPEAPISSCKLTLRLDTRKIFYADAIRSIMIFFLILKRYR